MMSPAFDLLDLPTRILNGLAAGEPIGELAATLCRLVEAHTPGRIASVMHMGDDGHLHVLAAPSAPPALVAELDRLAPGPHSGSCGNAVFSREPCLVADISRDPRWDGLRRTAEKWDLQSCWSWPIWHGKHIIGTFALTGATPGEPDAAQLHLLEFAASVAATLLSLQALQRQSDQVQSRLHWQARHDALTRLPNRFALDEALPGLLDHARAASAPLAVGMLDLDDFGVVNNTWGHLSGDAVLQDFAQKLRAALQPGDLLARTGGDEFILVLQGLHGTADVPRRLDALSGALPAVISLPQGGSVSLGMSLGLALFPQDGEDADTLLRRADAALHSAKLHKADRKSWWRRWGVEVDAEFTDSPDEDVHEAPYGPAASRLLDMARTQFEPQVERFVDAFYSTVARDPEATEVLSHLSEAEFTRLKHRQSQHLHRLLAADLSAAEHQREARRIGHIHALVGVPTRALVQSAGIYLMGLHDLVAALRCRAQDRRQLSRLLTARLQFELQTQVEAAQELRATYGDCLFHLDSVLQHGTTWAEFMQTALDCLTALPGMKAAGIGAPDASGTFVVELSSQLDPYVEAMRRHYGTVRLPTIQQQDAASLGPTASAWQFERISTLASYALAPAAAPWRDAALDVGIRSAAAVPLRDRNDRVVAVLSLYGAYPAMFERSASRSFLDNLAQLLSRAWQRLQSAARAQPVPIVERQRWRAALFDHGLHMHVQPLVDLQTGKPYAVEALARLRHPDGHWVSPGVFLPWFGRAELTRLFRAGLDQSLDALSRWDAQGVRLNLGLNLPLEVMLQPECSQWVREALAAHHIAPERLYLEILEGSEFDDPARRDAAVRALAALGARLVMDDLGSGYSSLLRLRTLPFHTVKIDQGLVREAQQDPAQVIGFVGALVQLAQSLGLWVVVEGLETPDLVEAAAILGADAGQGYALGRPMPAAQLDEWVQQFRYAVDPQSPRTPLGRLASDWLQRRQSGMNTELPAAWLRTVGLQHAAAGQAVVQPAPSKRPASDGRRRKS
jgi:diguanylate cyclase (GGDEF)-like protein